MNKTKRRIDTIDAYIQENIHARVTTDKSLVNKNSLPGKVRSCSSWGKRWMGGSHSRTDGERRQDHLHLTWIPLDHTRPMGDNLERTVVSRTTSDENLASHARRMNPIDSLGNRETS